MTHPKKITFMPTQYPWGDPWLRAFRREIDALEKRLAALENGANQNPAPNPAPTRTPNPEGKFITFEGVDGSGKSTVIAALSQHLGSMGVDHIVTRQPGGTPCGEKLRGILKDPGNSMGPMAEVLLLAASFHEGFASIIAPALADGRWVLCDRWTDSTLAYQCGGRGLDPKQVEPILELAVPLKPGLTIFCNTRPETAAQRTASRGTLDRFETEGAALQKAVHRFYAENTAKEPRTKTIDTEALGVEAAAETAIKLIGEMLGQNR